jgi:hypothetical protein
MSVGFVSGAGLCHDIKVTATKSFSLRVQKGGTKPEMFNKRLVAVTGPGPGPGPCIPLTRGAMFASEVAAARIFQGHEYVDFYLRFSVPLHGAVLTHGEDSTA